MKVKKNIRFPMRYSRELYTTEGEQETHLIVYGNDHLLDGESTRPWTWDLAGSAATVHLDYAVGFLLDIEVDSQISEPASSTKAEMWRYSSAVFSRSRRCLADIIPIFGKNQRESLPPFFTRFGSKSRSLRVILPHTTCPHSIKYRAILLGEL